MTSLLRKTLLAALFIFLLNACRKDDKRPDISLPQREFRFIRILASDATNSTLTLISPANGETQTFQTAHPNATVYPTDSRRFAALIFGAQNFVQFFDSGLEFHGDHVDIKGTAKFGAMTSSALKPTHFKSWGSESLIFNDGEGTLSFAHENDIHTNGKKMDIIDAGLLPHHGAMAAFDDGNLAVTVFDPASALPGPHGVKIIDRSGATVSPSTLAVSRLHGNAGDGSNALFGAAEGVLVVTRSGEQRLIPYPSGFTDQRLGTIIAAREAQSFFGFNGTKGVYRIDITNNVTTPVIESATIMQFKIDYAGRNIITIDFDGTLRIIDARTGSVLASRKVIKTTDPSATSKPVIEATSRNVYVTLPDDGHVKQFRTDNLDEVNSFDVSPAPLRMAILGFETDESH